MSQQLPKKFLSNKIFEYDEVVEILTLHLKQLHDIKSFCAEHKLNYNTVLLVINGKKPYPKLVIKLLDIFGYTVEKTIAFKFIENKEV